jgi:hypothetical protein
LDPKSMAGSGSLINRRKAAIRSASSLCLRFASLSSSTTILNKDAEIL